MKTASRAVATIANGSARSAVGSGPSEMPNDWNHQVSRTVIIVPKAIMSPWAKLAKRRMPKTNVTPRAPSASCEP
jgi:hypothetical protein